MRWGETFIKIALPQIATGKSSFLALLHAGWNLGCIGFIVYGIYVKKNYQESTVGTGSVITSVLASADTRNRSDLPDSPEYRRTWDETDIVRPVQEGDVLAIMTNSIITPQQKLGDCPEDIHIVGAHCTLTNTTNCAKGSRLSTGNGYMTGRCVNPSGGLCDVHTSGICTCEVSGWCPVEHKYRFVSVIPLFPEASDFKILVKAYMQFSEFEAEHRQNVRDDKTDTELLNGCTYDAELNPMCPVFTVGDILQRANVENFTQIAMEGGLIRITIKWDCNFDAGHERECQSPKYTFEQLNVYTVNKLLSFWNLRDSYKYHDDNGTLRRDTDRITGIFIMFAIDAKARQFNFVNTVLALGATFGLFNLITVALQKFITVLKVYHPATASALTGETVAHVVGKPPANHSCCRRGQSSDDHVDRRKKWEETIEEWKNSISNKVEDQITEAHCKCCDCCKGALLFAPLALLALLISVGTAVGLTIAAVRNESAILDWMALVWDSLFIVAIFAALLLFIALLVPNTSMASFVTNICFIFIVSIIIITLFLFLQVCLMFWFSMFGEFTASAVFIRILLMIPVDVIVSFGALSSIEFAVSSFKMLRNIFCCICCCGCGNECDTFFDNMGGIHKKMTEEPQATAEP